MGAEDEGSSSTSAYLDILWAVLPVYIAVGLGWATARLGVFQAEARVALGVLNRFVMMLGIPAIVFRILAIADLTQADWMFIACDIVYKLAAGVVLALPACCFRRFRLSEFVASHMVCTLPNTFILGLPLLSALMDPEVVETYAVLLIIVQSFFQLPATILLCEVGNAQRGADPAPPGGEVPQNGDNAARPSGRPGARPLENGREAFDGIEVHGLDDRAQNANGTGAGEAEAGEAELPMFKRALSNALGLVPRRGRGAGQKKGSGRFPRAGKRPKAEIVQKVLGRLVRNPILYGAALGVAFSLLNTFGGIPLPVALDKTAKQFADTVLGIALFDIGLFAYGRPVLQCSWPQLGAGLATRFVVSPALAYATALALGLRGELFKLFVLQAALPQAIVSFAIAVDYATYPNVFSTLVVVSTALSLPVLVVMNLIFS